MESPPTTTARPPPASGPDPWDCGSSLYDSFELCSFQRQLDSALSSSSARTLSMSRLPTDYETLPPQSNRKSASPGSKISRSLHKLVRSVFRRSRGASGVSFHFLGAQTKGTDGSSEGTYVFVYDKSGALSTIPEAPEGEHGDGVVSPETDSFVRRAISERFTAPTGSVGIPL